MEKLLNHQVKTKKHLIPIIVLSFGIVLISYLVAYQASQNQYNNKTLRAELFSRSLFQLQPNLNHFNQLLTISQKTVHQI
jgi:predicted transcriptional regulator YheO